MFKLNLLPSRSCAPSSVWTEGYKEQSYRIFFALTPTITQKILLSKITL